jgi:uncharacterized protein YndB with AHSA1/START domain
MNFLQSVPGTDPLVVEGLFNAPIEQVYRAWTDPEELVQWFGRHPNGLAAAEIDLRIGGRYRFSFPPADGATAAFEGEYFAVEPNAGLGFSWSHVREFADGRREATPTSRVTVRFEPAGKATRIHLRHEGISSQDARFGVGQGWNESLARLQAFIAEKEGARS